MQPPKVLTDLMKPLTEQNNRLISETLTDKINRVKSKFNLYHGKGKKKRRK